MTDNLFLNEPTAGSHDYVVSAEELQAKIQQLEQRLLEAEGKIAPKVERKPKKKFWKKAAKFFKTFVKPVLEFLPRFLNSLSNLKKAGKELKLA